jgi:hypothetical protein
MNKKEEDYAAGSEFGLLQYRQELRSCAFSPSFQYQCIEKVSLSAPKLGIKTLTNVYKKCWLLEYRKDLGPCAFSPSNKYENQDRGQNAHK